MAVSSVFSASITSPYNASFSNGELAISVVSNLNLTPPRSTYHLAKLFNFKGGIYTLKSVSVDGAL